MLRLFHTIRHLRIKQVIYQVYYRGRQGCKVQRFLAKKNALGFTALPTRGLDWNAPLRARLPFVDLPTGPEFIDWNDPCRPKLWVYHLHYFEGLHAVSFDKDTALWMALIHQWIDENPQDQGSGWEPYPLSLRIVNWIKWFAKQKIVNTEWLISLDSQVRALTKKVEYHILGNHLFANGKALVFAGAFFSGPQADKYLKKGLSIIDQEIQEQFLEDGGHFELSPMYHATLLWDVCDLVNLAGRVDIVPLQQRKSQWMQVIAKGLTWLNTMCHPDGKISFFNDAAFEMAPDYEELKNYLSELLCHLDCSEGSPSISEKAFAIARDDESSAPTIVYLPHSGYCAVSLDNHCKALLDVANIGASYQPGHAHADSLSFELSLYGQRVFVNSGTSTYAEGERRCFERSTEAHNTVTVDDKNSSDVWAAFRVARRAKPSQPEISYSPDKVVVACSHDGYLHGKTRTRHKRAWHFSHQQMEIYDTLEGHYKWATFFLYFHPLISHFIDEDNGLQGKLPTGEVLQITFVGARSFSLQPSTWSPRFGAVEENQRLVVQLAGNELITCVEWKR